MAKKSNEKKSEKPMFKAEGMKVTNVRRLSDTVVAFSLLGAGLGLLHGLAHKVVHIAGQKGLFHFLFSRRVDALPDDAGALDSYRAGGRADPALPDALLPRTGQGRLSAGQGFFQSGDIGRRGTAAAAQDPGAASVKSADLAGKVLR